MDNSKSNSCPLGVNLALHSYREHMKDELADQKAQDPHPHNDDTLRILEIGMGPGVNLDFYPKSESFLPVSAFFFLSVLFLLLCSSSLPTNRSATQRSVEMVPLYVE